MLKYLDANLEDWLSTVLSSARIGGSFLLALIGNAVLLPVVLFYLLHDWPQLRMRAWALVPPAARGPVGSFLTECDAMLGQYLRGQLLVMLVLAAYYSAGLSLAGFDLALPIGVFTGLAVFIPYLGFGLGLLLALLAGLLQFASVYGVVAVAVVFGVGQLLGGLRADAALRRRTHRPEPADGHLRAAGLRPSAGFHRRADRVAAVGAGRRRGGPTCVAPTWRVRCSAEFTMSPRSFRSLAPQGASQGPRAAAQR